MRPVWVEVVVERVQGAQEWGSLAVYMQLNGAKMDVSRTDWYKSTVHKSTKSVLCHCATEALSVADRQMQTFAKITAKRANKRNKANSSTIECESSWRIGGTEYTQVRAAKLDKC